MPPKTALPASLAWLVCVFIVFFSGCAAPVRELWPQQKGAPGRTIAASEPLLTAGGSRFYPAMRSYHLFHQCHQYAALALREAGLPLSAFWALNRAALAV